MVSRDRLHFNDGQDSLQSGIGGPCQHPVERPQATGAAVDMADRLLDLPTASIPDRHDKGLGADHDQVPSIEKNIMKN